MPPLVRPPKPWRDASTLASIGRSFYPPPPLSSHTDAARVRACETVQIWSRTGPLPHALASTASLVKAILHDEASFPLLRHSHRPSPSASSSPPAAVHDNAPSHTPSEPAADGPDGDESAGSGLPLQPHPSPARTSVPIIAHAAASTYALALLTFVTGLTDTAQTKRDKLSMYRAAENVGLPVGFVEIRNDIVHAGKIELGRMRAEAGRAMEWLWGNYWREIVEGERVREAKRRKGPGGGRECVVVEGEVVRLRGLVGRFREMVPALIKGGEGGKAKEGDLLEIREAIRQVCGNRMRELQFFADLVVEEPGFQQGIGTDGEPNDVGRCWERFVIDVALESAASQEQSQLPWAYVNALVRRISASKAADENSNPNQALAAWLARPWLSDKWIEFIETSTVLEDDVLISCLANPNKWTLQAAGKILYKGRYEELDITAWERRLGAAKDALQAGGNT